MNIKKFFLSTPTILISSIMAIMLLIVVSVPKQTLAATFTDFGTVTLRQGSRGTAVMNMQTTLDMGSCGAYGLVADGIFGPRTRAAVISFQSSRGLGIDGLVGPQTKNALVLCSNQALPNPTPTPGNNGNLQGGAGSINLTALNSNVTGNVAEGDSERVLGFRIEAEDSDVQITNLKVNFANTGTGSERLNNYIDKVSVVMMDAHDEKTVGSATTDDFDRTSGSPDTYSQSITLNNAIIREGDRATFYIVVSAADTLRTDDLNGADWVVGLDSIRFRDATGAILTENDLDDSNIQDDSNFDRTFSFESASENDSINIRVASDNPAASTLDVNENHNSDEALIGAFNLATDSDSSDIMINELPIKVTIDDPDNTANADDESALINSIRVRIGNTWYDADLQSENITNGDGTATYVVSFDENDFSVTSGNSKEVRIYATFNDQSGNYGNGTTISVSVTGSTIDAESDRDTVTVGGSFTGHTHTLAIDAPSINLVSTNLQPWQHVDGTGAGQEDVYRAQFVFDVTPPTDNDIYLPLTIGTNGSSGIEFTVTGGAQVVSATLDPQDGDIEENNSYRVSETERFTLSIYLRGNDASNRVQINSIWYELSDVTPNGNPEISSGLSTFRTNSVYLPR